MTITFAEPAPYAFPEQLMEDECEQLQTKVHKAMYEALACADTPFAKAGITFVQDGRFSKAKHSGYTVASFVGRFDKLGLGALIRRNLADSAKYLGATIKTVIESNLKLPADHHFSFDVERNAEEVMRRGSDRITALVTNPSAAIYDPDQVYAEFGIRMDECSAWMIVKSGSKFGTGDTLLEPNETTLVASTYAELGEKIAAAFNAATASR